MGPRAHGGFRGRCFGRFLRHVSLGAAVASGRFSPPPAAPVSGTHPAASLLPPYGAPGPAVAFCGRRGRSVRLGPESPESPRACPHRRPRFGPSPGLPGRSARAAMSSPERGSEGDQEVSRRCRASRSGGTVKVEAGPRQEPPVERTRRAPLASGNPPAPRILSPETAPASALSRGPAGPRRVSCSLPRPASILLWWLVSVVRGEGRLVEPGFRPLESLGSLGGWQRLLRARRAGLGPRAGALARGLPRPAQRVLRAPAAPGVSGRSPAPRGGGGATRKPLPLGAVQDRLASAGSQG